MTQKFENYGIRAEASNLSYTGMSGRYKIQASGVKRAVLDIVNKLQLSPEDNLLDIGCGVGDITIPLAMTVGTTTCVDHEKVLNVLLQRLPKESLNLVPGNFLDIEIEGQFDKILSYGVVLCLPSRSDAIKFVDKASSLLAPGGRLLIGDLPNVDKKHRFQQSELGKEFAAEWTQQMEDYDNQSEIIWAKEHLVKSSPSCLFDDEFLCDLLLRYRSQGFDAYILPQPFNLAFGYTREDLLLVRPS